AAARSTRTAHSSGDTLPFSDGNSSATADMGRSSSLAKVVQPGDVVVGDLAAHAVREPGEVLAEDGVRVRPETIGVRVIGAPDDIVLADQRHDGLEVLVLLVGDEALAAEVVAGLELEAERAGAVLVLGVEPVEDVGQPGHAGLAEHELEVRVGLAGAGGDDR